MVVLDDKEGIFSVWRLGIGGRGFATVTIGFEVRLGCSVATLDNIWRLDKFADFVGISLGEIGLEDKSRAPILFTDGTSFGIILTPDLNDNALFLSLSYGIGGRGGRFAEVATTVVGLFWIGDGGIKVISKLGIFSLLPVSLESIFLLVPFSILRTVKLIKPKSSQILYSIY